MSPSRLLSRGHVVHSVNTTLYLLFLYKDSRAHLCPSLGKRFRFEGAASLRVRDRCLSVNLPAEAVLLPDCRTGDLEPRWLRVCLALGETLWTRPGSPGRNTSVLSPLLQVPDVDGDGVPDLLILTREEEEVHQQRQPPILEADTGHSLCPASLSPPGHLLEVRPAPFLTPGVLRAPQQLEPVGLPEGGSTCTCRSCRPSVRTWSPCAATRSPHALVSKHSSSTPREH